MPDLYEATVGGIVRALSDAAPRRYAVGPERLCYIIKIANLVKKELESCRSNTFDPFTLYESFLGLTQDCPVDIGSHGCGGCFLTIEKDGSCQLIMIRNHTSNRDILLDNLNKFLEKSYAYLEEQG